MAIIWEFTHKIVWKLIESVWKFTEDVWNIFVWKFIVTV